MCQHYLVYSTYLGGSTNNTNGVTIAIDTAGHAYVAGSTNSTDFPVTPGAFQTSYKGIDILDDAFVTKLSPDGASLVYSTYLGGSGFETASAIRVDANGFAYVGGYTQSDDFPTTPGAFQPSGGIAQDGFISKLSADGTALIYSTYLGGNDREFLQDVAIDAAGSVYATGNTLSSDFPVTPGAFQTTLKGEMDAFVTKFSPDGSSLVYSTFVGGSGMDGGEGICIDEQGNAYVAGVTLSADFPVTPGAAQSAFGGVYDVVVFKVSADGSALVYSTYLGGDGYDYGLAIALACGKYACAVGFTYSSNFPTTPWVSPTALQGTNAAFLTIVSEDGTSFLVSNYIGGDGESEAFGIAAGADGSLYISGDTSSSNFSVTPGAFQPTNHGDVDAFVYRTRFAMYAKASVVLTKR